jgi:hypothetical protein
MSNPMANSRLPGGAFGGHSPTASVERPIAPAAPGPGTGASSQGRLERLSGRVCTKCPPAGEKGRRSPDIPPKPRYRIEYFPNLAALIRASVSLDCADTPRPRSRHALASINGTDRDEFLEKSVTEPRPKPARAIASRLSPDRFSTDRHLADPIDEGTGWFGPVRPNTGGRSRTYSRRAMGTNGDLPRCNLRQGIEGSVATASDAIANCTPLLVNSQVYQSAVAGCPAG